VVLIYTHFILESIYERWILSYMSGIEGHFHIPYGPFFFSLGSIPYGLIITFLILHITYYFIGPRNKVSSVMASFYGTRLINQVTSGISCVIIKVD